MPSESTGWNSMHGHIYRSFHREYDLTDRHFSVSCEVLNYMPVPIRDVLEQWTPRRT
ncbi:MAG TPA: hypothetical protein VFZ25_21385 [Chloroflexota bacterium]|nr:hypothetical protein [Chloroflexota bacterium]